MPREKHDNFGGLPKGVFDEIFTGCVTTRIPPLTGRDDLVIALLAALAREEHAGAVGGPGQTGVWEAVDLILTLRNRWEALRNLSATATSAQLISAVNSVAQQLDAIGLQWQTVGSADPSFYSTI